MRSMICWISSSGVDRASAWSASAGSPRSRSRVSWGRTPPLKSASSMASCSAWSVRSASSIPYGLPKPLDSRGWERFATRSSRSSSSSSSPVNLVYRYFMTLGPRSVVVLLLSCRQPDLFVHRRFFTATGPPRRDFVGGVAALFAPADFFLGAQPLEHEVDGRRDGRCSCSRGETGPLGQLAEALHTACSRDNLLSGRRVAEWKRAAQVEPFDDGTRVGAVEHAGKDVADGRTDQIPRDLFGSPKLSFVLQLELAGDRWQSCIEIRDARHDELLAVLKRAPLRVRHDEFESGDRQPLADAGSLVDLAIGPGLECDLLDDFADVRRNLHFQRVGPIGPSLLFRNCHRVLSRRGVVRADFRSDPVFKRSDDFPACRVIFGVCGEHEHHVQLQADRVA